MQNVHADMYNIIIASRLVLGCRIVGFLAYVHGRQFGRGEGSYPGVICRARLKSEILER